MTMRKMVYGATYIPYNEDSQKLLLPQTTDMSHKDNLKLLYHSLPEGMCDNEYQSLEQGINNNNNNNNLFPSHLTTFMRNAM